MSDGISAEPATRLVPAARRTLRALAGLIGAAALLLCSGALAQAPRPDAQPPKTPASAGASAAKPAHEPRLSKFEARRIRHACRERANERGAKGQEREAFLTRCYFGRVSHRGVRRDCAQLAAAKGVTEKNAVRDFVRECVKERTKP